MIAEAPNEHTHRTSDLQFECGNASAIATKEASRDYSQGAIEDLKKVVEIEPNVCLPFIYLARAEYDKGDYKSAMSHLDDMIAAKNSESLDDAIESDQVEINELQTNI
ncbi:unnamed protein product [Didymodactylos carnosus]|uniref:Tetratricopeptide repeat protein n=1 Tax=Didymodactylos carnosus TaxID=1234261 RepID=A0A814R7C4_9BILA|nr:unnamed protein product [Didymodactylos carnosus]CAF1128700.1 unnamed protein product [Didymodactylos carnosus]CAF3856458.1 unnamed protein product [Didymodactylos carnosus]CAF3892270.1 unnamed protein product [Didymodactylos carnosus]